jgi:REP element-mobilizing transposase RayT
LAHFGRTDAKGSLSAYADGLRRALAATRRRYAGIVHARRKRTGHFWQGRFGSVVMDEEHLAAAARYVSLNVTTALKHEADLERTLPDWCC